MFASFSTVLDPNDFLQSLFENSAGPSHTRAATLKRKAVAVEPVPEDATTDRRQLSGTPVSAVTAKTATATATTPQNPPKKQRRNVDSSAPPPTRIESPERLARTIFIGNVSTGVKENKTLKAFKKLLSVGHPDVVSTADEPTDIPASTPPTATQSLESIRFRSISFARNVPRNMRKIAFRNKELHEERDTMNAYAVFRTQQAAIRACGLINGVVFEGKHLRADMADGSVKKSPKKCVFIGNIAFDTQEESVHKFFSTCGDIDSVRLIRDAATNLGKGFGYVQFVDRCSVELAVRLHGRVFCGRDIRVTECLKEGRAAAAGGGVGKRKVDGGVGAVRRLAKGGGKKAGVLAAKGKDKISERKK